MAATVRLTIERGIAHIELNRPQRLNAINHKLLRDFITALEQVQADRDVAVIILHGAGRAFCAGDDLKDFGAQAESEEQARAFIDDLQAITQLLLNGDQIVIGAAHGWAVGGGLEWLLGCDLVLLADDTRAFFPEIELGLFVTGGASSLLPARVGLHKAKEMLLLAERFDAEALHALGLANRVVPVEDLLPRAEEIAQRVASLPATARRNAKHLLNHAFRASVDEAMAQESEATVAGLVDPASRARVRDRLTR